MPAPVSIAKRAALIAEVNALVAQGIPVRHACEQTGVAFPSYYRWAGDAKKATTPQAPKERAKKGRKPAFELTEAETKRLRLWRLIKGSVPLAVEAFIAESLGGGAGGDYLSILGQAAGKMDRGATARPELARALQERWQKAAEARKPPVWPLSIVRACHVTAAEEAAFRGRKAAESATGGTARRGDIIITAEGERVPWYAGAIWQSDDMSLNDPFRFYDARERREILGRQALFTQDAYSLAFLGCSHIGRDRDAYRAEDIAAHFRDIVSEHGLPLVWRIERGRWDNGFIWGCVVGKNEAGEEIRWGGLDAIIHIRDKWTSNGKASLEGSFDLLQAIMDHGFDGRTLSIGRTRGEFEQATRQMLRADRDEAAASQFWSITQSADAVQQAMALFNARPKRRHTFGNETRIPAELWAECVKRPCPADHLWRFCAIKTKATVRKGVVEVRAPHYAQSFRFRIHGAPKCPGLHLDNGHELLIAFDPAEAWQGCHIFNADKGARNREGWEFGQRLGVAEHMEDAPQEDLYAGSYSSGAARFSSQLRREFRSIVAGTPFAGRRVSHAQDGHGNALTAAVRGQATAQPPTPTPAAPRAQEPLSVPARAGREEALTFTRRTPAEETTTAPAFDELAALEELRALAL